MTVPPSRAELRRRFWRLLAITLAVAGFALAAIFGSLAARGDTLRLHMVVALTLGVTLSLLLAGALMGLVFLSARGGHDDQVQDRSEQP